MKGSPLFASFDFSVASCEPTLDLQLSGPLPALDSPWNCEHNALEGLPREKVVIESSAHGTCYRLVRKSSSRAMPVPVSFPEPRRGLARSTAYASERRSNIGNFQRVLIATEHKGTRRMLGQMLDQCGFETVSAATESEVLKIVQQKKPPEIVILSRTLTGTDVFKLCEQLSHRSSDYSPYILMLSMQNDKQDAVRALEAGASAHLTTPFETHELRAHLLVAVRILNRQESLLTSRDQYRLLATKDSLTGVWNRRSIAQILNDELGRAAQAERTTGVLLIDLDHFKRVNDTYGHLAGDLVLRETGRRLKDALRSYDTIGRYGGEEFLVVVPSANERELRRLGQRLVDFVSRDPIPVGEQNVQMTISVGAAIALPHENPAKAIAAADASLYDAKRLGRNRLIYSGQLAVKTAASTSDTASRFVCPASGTKQQSDPIQ
jgi:two-component system, cell cycle response regulator